MALRIGSGQCGFPRSSALWQSTESDATMDFIFCFLLAMLTSSIGRAKAALPFTSLQAPKPTHEQFLHHLPPSHYPNVSESCPASTDPDSTPIGVPNLFDPAGLVYVPYSWFKSLSALVSSGLNLGTSSDPLTLLTCFAGTTAKLDTGLSITSASVQETDNIFLSTASVDPNPQAPAGNPSPTPTQGPGLQSEIDYPTVTNSSNSLTVQTSLEPPPSSLLSSTTLIQAVQHSSVAATPQMQLSSLSIILEPANLDTTSDTMIGPVIPSTILGTPWIYSLTISTQSSSTPVIASSTFAPGSGSTSTTQLTLASPTTFRTEGSLTGIPPASEYSVQFIPTPSDVLDSMSTITPPFRSTGSSQSSSFPSSATSASSSGISSPVIDPGRVHKESSNHSKKLAAMIVPILLIGLVLLAAMGWWLLTRQKEKKRVDRLASKAVWMDQDYVNSIREKMMGMDEEKISNTSLTASPSSKASAIRPLDVMGNDAKVAVIADTAPALRGPNKRVSRAEVMEMEPTTRTTKALNIGESAHAPVDPTTNKVGDSLQKLEDDFLPPAAGALKIDDNSQQETVHLASPSPSPSTSDDEDESQTQKGAATSTETTPLHDVAIHTRSDSVASRLSRRLERALRRRSGLEELRG